MNRAPWLSMQQGRFHPEETPLADEDPAAPAAAAQPGLAETGATRMTNPGLLALLAWVFGVALQLQQVVLWPMAGYAGLLLAGLLALAGWRVQSVRGARRFWLLGLALAAGLLCGFGLTGLRASHFAQQALAQGLQGLDIDVSGRVAQLPRQNETGEHFVFEVETAETSGTAVKLPARLQLSWYSRSAPAAGQWPNPPEATRPVPGLQGGDRWRFTVRLRSPHGNANPYGFDRERWLWEHGIGATGYVRTSARDAPPRHLGDSGQHRLERWRQAVARRITAQVPEPRSAGVLAALVVGEQGAIERRDWDLFRTTGVAHLMSISGLHVTLFAWLATLLIGAVWRRLARPWPQALLAVPAPLAAGVGGVALALLYALFSGWGVPAQRTVLMLAVVVALRLLVRPWPWPVVWLLAMAAVLLLDPWAWLQPGFWLSFVAVGILFATDPAQRHHRHAAGDTAHAWHQRALHAASRLVREQAVVTVALAPLSLLLFGQFSLVGLLANLLAIPWVTLVVTPLALLGVLMPPLWWLASVAVQGMAAVLAWFGQWPWAAVFVAVPPLHLALAAVLGGALLVLRLPWAVRLVGLLLVWPVLLWSPPRPAPGQFELMAIDVGQGSAVLVRTAQHSLLYDTGPRYSPESDAGQRVVVPLLRALGERPDAVVVSHQDSDHAGGMAAVRTAWPQARWLSSFEPQHRCVAGQRWHWDGVDFEVLHPQVEHYRADGQGLLSSNAMSCVLRVSAGSHSAWLGGDIDAAQETRLAMARPDQRATVMLAPHHGSQTSSSPVLLNTLQPRWVLVQSGYRNRFGHPAPVVLARYRQRGIPWVASPDCGAATWRSADPDMVHCHREAQRRYWHCPPDQPSQPVDQPPTADPVDDQ